MDIQPLSQAMGAEVRGVDLSRPLDDAAFGEILHAFHRHMVLVFRDAADRRGQQIAFSRRFGELQVHVLDAVPPSAASRDLRAVERRP